MDTYLFVESCKSTFFYDFGTYFTINIQCQESFSFDIGEAEDVIFIEVNFYTVGGWTEEVSRLRSRRITKSSGHRSGLYC